MSIEVDGDGFLLNRDAWNQDIMRELAENDGVTLNEDHVKYILSARQMYDDDGVVPAVRNFAKHHGMDRKAKALYELFESGPMKKICKWGGLPKPTGCV